MMRVTLPDWLIIGAAKSGTTALHAMAVKHPGICSGTRKEPRYFGSNWHRGLAWYAEHFVDCPPATLVLDASVEYTLARCGDEGNPIASRIANTLPWGKLVYIARDPVERIASNLRMMSNEGYFGEDGKLIGTAGLERAIHSDPRFLDRSRYWWHVQQYRRHFPDECLLLLVQEDLLARPDEVMQRLYHFLGLPPHPVEGVIRTQVTPGPRLRAEDVLGHDLAQRLRAELRPDSEEFLKHAGLPSDYWA